MYRYRLLSPNADRIMLIVCIKTIMNKILLFVKMHKATERNINVKFAILWRKKTCYDKEWIYVVLFRRIKEDFKHRFNMCNDWMCRQRSIFSCLKEYLITGGCSQQWRKKFYVCDPPPPKKSPDSMTWEKFAIFTTSFLSSCIQCIGR